MLSKIKIIVVLLLILVSCNFTKSNSVYDYYVEDNSLVLYAKFNNNLNYLPGGRSNQNSDKFQFLSDRFGVPNSALLLDSNFIAYGNILNQVISGHNHAFSISFWIKPTNNNSDVSLISKNSDSNCNSNQRQFNLKLTKDGLIHFILFDETGKWGLLESEVRILDNKWSSLIITYKDGGKGAATESCASLYINGEKINLKLVDGNGSLSGIRSGSAELSIGTMVNSEGLNCYDSFYNGLFDDLLIFDRKLTIKEIDYLASLN